MNRVVLMGRLTADPQVTEKDGTVVVARYTLAVDRRFAKKDDPNAQTADFPNVVVFGKGAEFAQKYFHKGTKICIDGRIQTGSYTNKDGVKVYTTDVVAENQEFAESKNASGGQSQPQTQAQPQNQGGYQNMNGAFNVPVEDNEELPWV